MKPETFVCIVPSPAIPLGSKAIKVFEQEEYGAQVYAVFSPNHPKEYETWYPITRLTREQVEQNPECWKQIDNNGDGSSGVSGYASNKRSDITYAVPMNNSNDSIATFPKELAEQKRQESMAKRLDYIPDYMERHWSWSFTDGCAHWYKIARLPGFGQYYCDIGQWNIGNVHRTEEDAEKWGREYAQYFQIPNQE